MGVAVRLVTVTDAPTLAGLALRNREALAPWEPVRPERYYSQAGQREMLEEVLAKHARAEALPGLILVDGVAVGRITVSTIVWGAFRSGDLGYWVDEGHRGRGVATAAVGKVLQTAFSELGLHRVQAATLLHNTPSRRVLAHHGFTEIGVAPRYLQIAGRWQDQLLHQRLADEP